MELEGSLPRSQELPPARILSQINPVRVSQSHFLKICFNIILPSTPGSLSLRFPHQNFVCTCPLPRTCYVPRTSHSYCFDHPANIWWELPIIKPLIISSSTPHRLSAIAYSIYSRLPSILDSVPPSSTWGCTMPWWQRLTQHGPCIKWHL